MSAAEERIAAAHADDRGAGVEAKRVRALKPAVRKRIAVLSLWCESGSCRVGTVYSRSGRLLLEVRQPEGQMRDDVKWKGFAGHWLDVPRPEIIAFTCPCTNTSIRALSKSRLVAAVEGGWRGNAGVAEFTDADA